MICNCCETGRHRVSASRDVFLSHQRARRSTCQRLHGELSRSSVNPLLHTWLHTTDNAQRRHVSSHTDPPDPPNPPGPSSSTLIEAVDFIKQCTKEVSDLEAAWKSYRHYKSHGQDVLSAETLLTFASRLLDAVPGATPPAGVSSKEYWKMCGIRVISLLQDLEPRISNKEDRSWLKIHFTSAYAFADRFEDAIRHSRELSQQYSLNKRQRTAQLKGYCTLVRGMEGHLRPEALVELVVEDWDTLSPWFLHRPLPPLNASSLPRLRQLRSSVSHIICRIDDPAKILRSMEGRRETILRAAGLMAEVYCQRKLAHDAMSVLHELRRQSITPPIPLTLMVVNGLAKMKRFEQATRLLMTLADRQQNFPVSRPIYVAALNLFTRWGDRTRAEDYFQRLEERKWVSRAEVATMMNCYAVLSDPESAVELFERYFSEDAEDPSTDEYADPSEDPSTPVSTELPQDDSTEVWFPEDRMVPTIVHYTAIIRAYSRSGNQDGMNEWLQRFQSTGISLDGYLFHIILENFIQVGDVESATSVLDQMRAARIVPQPYSYTSLISLFAKRREAEGAERVLKMAFGDGVVPDRDMLSAYMFAQVEAGNWPGVVRAFDYIQSSRHMGIRVTIDLFNNLLKAYVLIGAPFNVVVNIFRRLREAHVEPDQRTYSLVIQSACDAGRLDTAEDLLKTLETKAEKFPEDIRVNVYVLTIMMGAYLRADRKDLARGAYEKMMAYNINPTSITFSKILKSYGNPRVLENIDRAENFLSEVMAQENKSWMKGFGGRAQALQNVYGPVMTAWLKKVKATDMERLHNEMLEHGGRPTLGTLTLLMDVYRRKLMPEKVRGLWPQIYELARKYGDETEGLFGKNAAPHKRNRGSLLCVPLSIYTDAMSADGDHHALAAAWTQVQKDGFVPDAHNWNHLCIALLRAGQVERAFALIEQIIIPIQQRSQYTEPREAPPIITPFFSDVDPRLVVPSEGALHNARRRSGRVGYHSTKLKPQWTRGKPDDFVHPLHILYQLSPAWNVWRPHNIVLRYLAFVLRHLRRGGLIEPVHQPGHIGVRLSNMAETDEDIIAMRQQEASEMYDRIKQNYPLTYKTIVNMISGRNALYTKRVALREQREAEAQEGQEEGVEEKAEEGGREYGDELDMRDMRDSDFFDGSHQAEEVQSRSDVKQRKKYSRST